MNEQIYCRRNFDKVNFLKKLVSNDNIDQDKNFGAVLVHMLGK